jgi:hypothetical protein
MAEIERKQLENQHAWSSRLQADPKELETPSDLSPGLITNGQLHLLQRVLDDGLRVRRGQGASWTTLSTEFGPSVAHAFRDAAVAKWRQYSPPFGSSGGDRTSIPWALTLASYGLEIDVAESSEFFVHLTVDDAQQMMRYVVWELNGFSNWFESLYRAFPRVVTEIMWRELEWELMRREADRNFHYILDRVTDQAAWLHHPLSEKLFNFLQRHEPVGRHCLEQCLRILSGAQVSNAALARLARQKTELTPSLVQLPRWYALLVSSDPLTGIPSLESRLNDIVDYGQATVFAQQFVIALIGERHSNGHWAAEALNPSQLMQLYVLMHRFIRHDEDIDRSGGATYSPGLRDDAQDARNRLFEILAATPGESTYAALKQLERDHPVTSHRHWMGQRARDRAIKDADLELWTVAQFKEFASELEITPSSNRQLFKLACSRLVDFKDWLENGNDSLAATYQRVAGEPEMRGIVYNWLNARASGRYTVSQESELANAQRPDLQLHSAAVQSPICIELKIAEKWSGPSLCERLRNQLVGDYMRERTAQCGVFLLVRRSASTAKKWRIGGRAVTFDELPSALEQFWKSISGSYPEIESIRVIGIDLTVRAAVASS